MAGTPSLTDAAVAIASLLVVLRSLGNYNGFLRKFVTSLTSSKSKSVKKRFENKAFTNYVLTGGAIGFALAIPASLIPLGWSGYLIGGVAFIAGTALYFSKPEALVSFFMAFLLISMGMLPAFAIDVNVDETEHLPYDQPNGYHYDYESGYWDSETNTQKYYGFEETEPINREPYNITDISQSLDFEFLVQINDYDERQYKPLSNDQIYVTLNNVPRDLEYTSRELYMADEINYGKPLQELWTSADPPSDVTSSHDFMVRQGDEFSIKVNTFGKPCGALKHETP